MPLRVSLLPLPIQNPSNTSITPPKHPTPAHPQRTIIIQRLLPPPPPLRLLLLIPLPTHQAQPPNPRTAHPSRQSLPPLKHNPNELSFSQTIAPGLAVVYDVSFFFGEYGVIASHAAVFPREPESAALSEDYVSWNDKFGGLFFGAETFSGGAGGAVCAAFGGVVGGAGLDEGFAVEWGPSWETERGGLVRLFSNERWR